MIQFFLQTPSLPTELPFVGDPSMVGIGIALIVVSLIVIIMVRKIVVNTILGAILWGIVSFVFNIQLPLLPSIIIAVLFGPAGIGVLLLLRFFGVI